jgi:uncharacterized protein YkwD
MFNTFLNLAIHYFHSLLQLSIYILSKLAIIICIFTVINLAQTPASYQSKRPRIVQTTQDVSLNQTKTSIENEVEENLNLEQSVFEKLNQYRVSKGMPELIWNEQLAKVARFHSENMAKYKFFNHKGLDGKMVDDRAKNFGLSDFRGIGENICYNQGYENPSQTAVESWLNSGGHRENLLRKIWKESAIGVAVADDGTYYFTEVFITK